MNHKKVLLVVSVLAGLLLASFCLAEVPQLINYQGMLVDPGTGEGLDGSYSMTFAIYATETGGTALWTETQTVVVNDGLFSVLLGSGTAIPFDLFDETTRYLGVKVGSDPEMTPRKRLVSVGYAFKANDADNFAGKDTADFVQTGQANSISTAMIVDDAITAAKIAPTIVSSVDGVANDGGDVDLIAGSNVTITPNDEANTITISATPGGGGDNLGDHTATQNVKLNNHWLSGDGGNEGVFVKADGKVGIGMNAPAYLLDVMGDINTASSGFPGKSLRLYSGSDQRVIATNDLTFRYADAGGNAFARFVENGNERMRIHNGGNVGIGVTNPAQKLDVNGTVQMTGFKLTTGAAAGKVLTADAAGVGTWQTVSGDNLGNHTATQNIRTNSNWISGDGDSEGIFVSNVGGKVGVGTNAPNSTFKVVGSTTLGAASNTATQLGDVSMGEGSGASGGASISMGKDCASSAVYSISIGRNATANNTGAISIGYYTNSYGWYSLALGSKIHVAGNSSVGIGLDNTQRTVSAANVMSIMGGKVGIGTLSPAQTLDVSGTAQMTGFILPTGAGAGKVLTSDASGTGTWQTVSGDNLGNHTATQNVRLSGNWLSNDGGSEGLFVATDGKVGVATNTPNSTFKVVGSTTLGTASNSATQVGDVAMGEGCGASGGASISMGKDCASSAVYSISIGRNATANNVSSVSIGYYTNSYGWYSTALGSRIHVGGNYSVGIGLDNTQRTVSSANVMSIMGGKVGIGVLSPGNILTVEQSSATDPIADSWSVYSSRRWKTNITVIDDALELVQKLRGVFFDWKADGKHDIGLIAEEVGEIVPEVVAYEENGIDAKSVDYSRLVAVLIEAVKQQQNMLQTQQVEINHLKEKIENR